MVFGEDYGTLEAVDRKSDVLDELGQYLSSIAYCKTAHLFTAVLSLLTIGSETHSASYGHIAHGPTLGHWWCLRRLCIIPKSKSKEYPEFFPDSQLTLKY